MQRIWGQLAALLRGRAVCTLLLTSSLAALALITADVAAQTFVRNVEQVCTVLEISEEDCDRISAVRTEGNREWLVSSFDPLDSDSGDNIRSPTNPPDDTRLCLILDVNLPVRTHIEFHWRAETEVGNDYFDFYINDRRSARESGGVSWRQVSVNAIEAVTDISWCYDRDGSGSTTHYGRLDRLRFMPTSLEQLVCDTLGMSSEDCDLVSVTTERGGSWLISNFNRLTSGGPNLRSPQGVADDSMACLDLTVNLPANSRINFYWNIQTEENSDYFAFYINNERFARDAGTVGWRLLSVVSPEVATQLSWCYERDSSGGDPSVDHGRLDSVQFNVQSNPWAQFCDTLQLNEAECAQVISVRNDADHPWGPITGSETFSGQGYQSDPDLENNEMSVLAVTLAPGITGLEFYRRVDSQGSWDWLIFEYNDNERGDDLRPGIGIYSSAPYRSLPFFNDEGRRVQGDLSGDLSNLFVNDFFYGDGSVATSDINLGTNNEWSLLRLLPDDDITELRWIYRKDASRSTVIDRGFIDSLQLHPALTDNTQLCSALDLGGADCSAVQSFAQEPLTRLWIVDDNVTPPPRGGSALRVPLRVPDGEKACLSLTQPIAIRHAVVFAWRLDADSNSMLTFEVGDTVKLTLTGNGSDSGWTTASWTTTEAIDSFSWCYQGAEVTRAWVDALSISLNQRQNLCFALRLNAADCALVTSVETSTDHPWELVMGTETFSGRGFQSGSNIPNVEESVLTATLAPGVVGLEFYRRVSSEAGWDWLILEYDDAERGDVRFSNGCFSEETYQALPYFNHLGVRVEGDISGGGDPPSFIYGNRMSSSGDTAINLGSNGQWSLLRLLPDDGDITELRWIYRSCASGSSNADRGWIDSLRLYPVLTDDNLCEALDIRQCNAVESFAQLPPERQWTVDDRITPTPMGGSALRAPLRVTNNEKTCLSLSLPIAAGLTVMFSWRLNADSNSALTFEVNDTVELTLTGDGSDSGWTMASWNVTAAIDSLSWCYRGAEVSRAWVDALSISPVMDKQQFCSALRLSEVDCALVESVETSPGYPWEIITGSETFSGRGFQSNPGTTNSQQSVLTVTLAAGVVGLEFYRRVSSEGGLDWFVFEYDDIERGYTGVMLSNGAVILRSNESYQALPFFGADNTRIHGDLSGIRGGFPGFIYGNGDSADSDINSGPNNQWSLLRLLPTDGGISELRWIYSKDRSVSQGEDRAWIDSLRLYPAVTTSMQICEALDLDTRQCNAVQSFTQQPPERQWTVDSSITPPPMGGSALRVPLRVLNNEKACLSLTRPLAANHIVVFSWRLNADSNSMLTFEVGDTVELTLTGNGSDSSWETVTWTAPRASNSLSWCYRGAEATRAWVDAMSVSYDKRPFCSALRLSEADCALVESVDTSADSPWEITTDTETFSGQGYQSDPSPAADSESVLTATLAPGVVGLEFLRRVSSQESFDWLIFEYNDAERGSIDFGIALTSLAPYQALPFFDGAGSRVQGDLSGSPRSGDFRYGNRQLANSDINLGNNQWSLLRLLPVADDITELRWIYRKNEGVVNHGSDRGWIDSLQLHPAMTTAMQLCEALDLEIGECNAVRSFTRQPPERQWIIDDNVTPPPMGGNALRVPLRVLDDEKACLTLSRPFAANHTVMFSWRLNAGSNSMLTFEVNDTVELTLTGTGSDSGWTTASWSATERIDSFSWCYEGAEVTQAWVDALSFEPSTQLQAQITEVVPMLTGIEDGGKLSEYSLAVTVGAQPLFSVLNSADYSLNLTAAGADAELLSDLSVIGQIQQGTGIMLAATLRLELFNTQLRTDSIDLELLLGGAPTAPDQGFTLMLDVSTQMEMIICSALDMEQADCELLSGFSTTVSAPWRVTSASFQSGDSLLGSGMDVADDEESCLTLEFASGSELPVGGRMDFLWAVDAAAGDGLQLQVNGMEIANLGGLGADIITPRQQQRLAPAAVSSLAWCYIKDNSGAEGTDRGWVDGLQLLQPEEVLLTVTATTHICAVLDLTEADCEAFSTLSQSPDTLYWDTDSSTPVQRVGGSSLRTPQTVADGETACLTLTLEPPLLTGTRIGFWWRVDSAAASALELRFNGAALTPPVSISGLASEVMDNNGWQYQTGDATAELTSLGWCYSHARGMFAGTEQGWVDGLELYPALSDNTRLCEALDFNVGCTFVQSFAEQPPEQAWIVDSNITPAPVGGSALRVPFRVPDGEETCLSVVRSVIAGSVVAFSWRLNADSSSMLTFEVDDTVVQTLTTISSDTGWVTASWTATEAVNSFAWCYQGVPATQAWVDALRISFNKQQFCSVLRLGEAECALVESVDTSPDYPWEITTGTETFSGRGYQSAPNLAHDEESVLIVTLAPGVAGLEFHRRVSSEIGFDWLIFEYDDNERGSVTTDFGLFSLESYRTLPFFNGAGSRVHGDLSGTTGNYLYGNIRLANNDINLGDNNQWSLLRLLPDDDVTVLRWIYRKDRLSSQNFDRGWIDGLQLYPAVTTATQLCEALDQSPLSCDAVQSLASQPVTLQWSVDDSVTPAPAGGSALRFPLRVPDGEKACLSLSLPVIANQTVMFFWRLDAAASSTLTFEVGDRVVRTLTAAGNDTGWTTVSWSVAEAIDSFAWCYEGAPVTRAWVDALRISSDKQQFCFALRMSEADCALVESVETSPDDPWEIATGTTETFSGRGYQSAPGLDNSEDSVLTVTLVPGVLGLEFHRRVSSERNWDWFIFEYDDNERGYAGSTLFSSTPYRSLPFFNGAGTPVQGDLSGFSGSYSYGNNRDASSDINLGNNNQWSLLRLLPADDITELRWIYRKDGVQSGGADRAWIDSLRLYPAVANRTQLCEVLDLPSDDCDAIQSFAEQPSTRMWAVDDSVTPAPRGGSALRVPLRVTNDEKVCLSLSRPISIGDTVVFSWRLNAATKNTPGAAMSNTLITTTTNSILTFEVDDTVELMLSSDGGDSPWTTATWTTAKAVDSFAWCYQGGELTGAWVDVLSFEEYALEIDIAAVTTPVLTEVSVDGLRLTYSFQVQVVAPFSTLTAGVYDIGLRATGADAAGVTILEVTGQAAAPEGEDGLILAATLGLQLQQLRSTVKVDLGVRGNQAGSQLHPLMLDVSAETLALICIVLDMEQADCNLLGGFSSTVSAPWQVTTASFQSGENLLGSGTGVADDGESCLTLDFAAGSELPMAGRMDFLWAVDAAMGDGLQLQVGGMEFAGFGGLGAGTIAPHRQQRFATAAVSSLTWCYTRDSSGAGGADRGWVDDLQLLQPQDAVLLPAITDTVCTVLDIPEADCAVFSMLSQLPETLNWDTDSTVQRSGESSLRTPQTVADTETACLNLTLDPPLPVGTGITFWWRVDSAAGNVLELYFNNMALTPRVSISGLASEVIDNNGWQYQTGEVAAGLTSLGWCYSRMAGMFAGTERGWIDRLQLHPAVTTPTQLCSALDLDTGQCNVVQSFAPQPPERMWVVDDGITPAPVGGSALRVPLRVPDGEKACLTVSRPVAAHHTVVFSWRLNADSNSNLTFEVDDTVVQTLTANSTDTGWVEASWTAAEAVDSFAWCYEGAPVTRAWVDALRISPNEQRFCFALRMSEADCALVELVDTSPGNPWEMTTATETLSGRGYQSDPNIGDGQQSVLTVTLAAGVVGLEFHRRVSSEIGYDWLIFEYDDADRGPGSSSGQGSGLLSLEPYRSLPFFDGAGTGVQGDLSGFGALFSYGDGLDDAGSDINLGDNNQWSLLRLLPTDGNITELRWIYRKDANDTDGSDRAWIESLRLHPAVTTAMQLCEALDLEAGECNAVQSFAQQPPARMWTVDDSITPTPAGGSALRVPLRVLDEEKACLSLTRPVAEDQTIMFFWRLNADSDSMLTFEVNDTVELTLTGDGSDSGWTTATWIVAEAVNSFSWCYEGAEVTQAWVSALSFVASAPILVAVTEVTPMLANTEDEGQLGEYSLAVTVEPQSSFSVLNTGDYNLELTVAGADAGLVSTLIVTAQEQQGTGILLSATLQLELLNPQLLRDSVALELHLGGAPTASPDQGFALMLDVTAQMTAIICSALDMEQTDCELLSGFSTSAASPWQITTVSFRDGDSLLGSGAGLADDSESCLTLEFAAGSELPAAGRIDFLWAVDAAAGDGLQLRVGGTAIANFGGLGAGTITPHRQQRFATAAVSSLAWCYIKDGSGAEGADRGWVDELQLLQPPDATLLPATANDLCAVLDMTEADCAVVSTLSQSPDTLNWGTDSSTDTRRLGGSSLRTPQTVADDEMACLTLALAPNLPAGSSVAFWWRVDSAVESALELRFNGAALTPPVSISGLASEVTSDNGWQLYTGEVTAELTSLGWCYSRVAGMFAGTEQGWVDNLQLYPAVATTMQLCETLDLDTDNCTILQSFAEQPPEREWTVDDSVTPAPVGGSALRVPLKVTAGEKTCLSVSRPVTAGSVVGFFWRLEADSTSTLTFEVNDTVELTLSGDDGDSGWTTASWTTAEVVDLFVWCYQGAEMTQAWVDALSFTVDGLGFAEPPLEIDIAAVSTPVLTETSADGRRLTYSLEVRVAAPFFTLMAGEHNIALRYTGTDAAVVTTLVVTSQAAAPEGDGALILAATLRLELQQLRSTVEMELGLSGDAVGSQVLPLMLDVSAETLALICLALDMEQAGCELLGAFSTTESAPWQLATAAFQSGNNLLGSGSDVADDSESCLTLEFAAGAELPVAGRMDFLWAVDAAAGDGLQLQVGDTEIASFGGLGAGVITPHRQQRFATAAVSSLTWCYRKDAATSEGADRGWVDDLELLQPLDAALPPATIAAVCMVLDMTAADCAVISELSQSPDTLNWGTDSAVQQAGESSLRSPQTVTDDETACLTLALQPNLPVGSRVAFWWRVDSAAESALELRLGGAALTPPVSISGLASSITSDNGWQLHTGEVTAALTSLGWCYSRVAGMFAGTEQGWVDNLQLYPAVTIAMQLCETLDLDTGSCTELQSFAEQPPERVWIVDDSVTPAPPFGDSALRVPFEVTEDEKTCLSLSLPVAAGYTVAFSWRLNAASGTNLTFEVGDTAELTLSGDGSDSGWIMASWTTAEAIDSFAWCYQGAEMTQAWVDGLSLTEPTLEIDIAAVTMPMLTGTSANGQQLTYSLQVRVAAPFFTLTAGEYEIGLRATGTDAAVVTVLEVTTQTAAPEGEDGLILAATLRLELQQLQSMVKVNLGLSGDEVGSQVQPLMLDVSAETLALICLALDMEQADCDLLGAFSTTESAPWQLATAAFQSGNSLLGSGSGVADDGESCLTLEFAAGSELPVAGRMDFLWAVDAATGDGLQLQINGTEIANFGGLGAGVITPHRQQRFATAAVSSLTWCYTRDVSGTGGADRGWIDDLQLQQPVDATLTPATIAAVCMVLDITEADCSVLGALSQSPDTLNWDTDSAVHLAGGNSLRTPQTVTDGEMACLTLTLEPTLPAGTEVAFRWRVDSAAASALELRFNGAALTPPVNISGLASEVTRDNGWRSQTGEAAAELTSLGWCYSRVAGQFAGTERGWVEQLQLNPPFSAPTFTAGEVTRLANNGIQFDLQLRPGSGEAALPAGVVVLVRQDNLENVVLTTVTASATAIDYQVTATVMETNDIARLRFSTGPLPPALDAFPESAVFAVTIESQTSVDAAMLLRRLSVEPPSASPGISINDLLLGLRLSAGEEVETVLANLGRNNGDRAAEMLEFTEFLADPERSGAVDINDDDVVDALDFRLMVRYLSGLRGEELLCDSLCEARLQILFSQ